MTTDDLAGLLREHSMYSYQPYAKGYVCDCGVTIFRTPEDADADESLLGKHAAHQAAVIAAAGWVRGRDVEWGTQVDDGDGLPYISAVCWSEDDARQSAERHDDTTVVRRYVTEWEEA